MTESVLDWMRDRRDTALQIARTKSGDERIGWLADAVYLAAAEQALRAIDPAELDRLLDEAIGRIAQREWPA